MSRIWQNYLLKEISKIFCLLLFSFLFLYILMDASNHFHKLAKVSLDQIALYYICQWSRQADFLFILALLISNIKVITTLMHKHELVAFQAAGQSLQRALFPLFTFSFLVASLLYLNFQTLEPYAQQKVEWLEETLLRNPKKAKIKRVNVMALMDDSKLIFQKYDPAQKEFKEVFWIQSQTHVFHFKYLKPFNTPPLATFAEELEKQEEGWTLINTTPSLELHNLYFQPLTFNKAEISPRYYSLATLLTQLHFRGELTEKEASLRTAFYYKLFLPLGALIAFMGPASYICRFTRNPKTYWIYTLALCGFLTFLATLNAGVILGENRVIPPSLAIGLMPLLLLSYFGYRWFFKNLAR